jgi:methylenetetrahydrofolate reductase (NADPH)
VLSYGERVSAELLEIKVPVKRQEKVIDKINKCIEQKKKFFSFEFFPPKSQAALPNLCDRMERMAVFQPLFMSVSCEQGSKRGPAALELCAGAQKVLGTEIILHMTCANKTETQIKAELDQAQANGVNNILALRGDNCRDSSAFPHAVDFVRFIRSNYGNSFGICVAGYPEGHVDSKSALEEMTHLKAKVDAGADFIMSQIFYEASTFLRWRDDCISAGITVPIIPGIMPLQSFDFYEKMRARIRCEVCHLYLKNCRFELTIIQIN